ncbi:hypothetical protein POM88_031328 [Heracleum sosnowskyi]|uniref:Uncharacterized protein n=1 Tax=Heracleum sosnowskyi TaxID=360622 RepID=A0AAD8MGI3_9APIA|nr:hypothetical protein POM88_031328 [Heracleum sosnowskyi]
MGNTCCRGEAASSMVFPHIQYSTERDSLLGSSASDYDDNKQLHAHREVKIKITKEKLEELLGKSDLHGMPVDQIVSGLISASADHHYYNYYYTNDHVDIQDSLQFHHRSWRPALQTIPEVN